MKDLQRTIWSIKDNPVSFAFDGVIERPPLPGLHVQGIKSPILLPLCEKQAEELIGMFKGSSRHAIAKSRYF